MSATRKEGSTGLARGSIEYQNTLLRLVGKGIIRVSKHASPARQRETFPTCPTCRVTLSGYRCANMNCDLYNEAIIPIPVAEEATLTPA